jgi:hypothetical protein
LNFLTDLEYLKSTRKTPDLRRKFAELNIKMPLI